MSTPFSAATSINTPRVMSAPTFSIPSLLKPVRLWVHERALRVHVEAPGARDRHLGGEHVAELDDLAGSDQSGGAQHGLGLHVIGGPTLIAGAPFRGTAPAVRRRTPRLGVGGFADQNERRGQRDTDREVSHGALLR